jgi:hypothetical protein
VISSSSLKVGRHDKKLPLAEGLALEAGKFAEIVKHPVAQRLMTAEQHAEAGSGS